MISAIYSAAAARSFRPKWADWEGLDGLNGFRSNSCFIVTKVGCPVCVIILPLVSLKAPIPSLMELANPYSLPPNRPNR